MKISRVPSASLVLTLLGLSSLLSAGTEHSTLDDYVAQTIGSIIKQHQSDASRTEKYFAADNSPSRVKVIYLAQQRSLPKERAAFLDKYFLQVKKQPDFRKLLKSEVLVREGEHVYWMPIQTDLIAHLNEEVNQGAEVELFIIWLGALHEAGKLEWVFAINEFQPVQGK